MSLGSNPNARMIGWDFPFVSQEQQNRLGMHGYVAAYILPEGFDTECPGVEYAENGIVYMDVYIHVDGVTKVDAFSQFN